MATQNPTASTSILTGKVADIGTVKMVIGTVSATSSDGVVRVLQVGDKVNANDVIQTGDLSSIDIEFVNGAHMDLGRNAQTVLDTDVFNPAAAQAAVADAAAIQAAIAAGADPTAIAAATAAGAGTASEGGHTFVQVDPNYAPGNVTSGFETDVVTRTFATTEGLVAGPVTPTATVAGVDVTGLGGGAAMEGSPVTFQVTLSSPVGADTVVQVNVFTGAGNTATAGADYDSHTYEVIIPAGSTSATFNVPTVGDAIFEGNETFSAQIVSATSTGSTINVDASAATGTIIDNDTPTVSVAAVEGGSATEGSPVTFQVSMDKMSDQDTTVQVNVFTGAGNTATADTDYDSHTYEVIIPAGSTSATFDVPTVDDAIYEGDETFSAQIVSATNSNGAVILDGTAATGTILDNENRPTLSINDVSVNEAAGTALFTVTLSGPSAFPVTVHYATANGSALAGQDYTATSGNLTFAAGVTSQTISVPITNDLVYEGTETFNVNLTAPTNATVADGLGVGTILDNENRPTLSINDVSVNEAAGTALFTVTLSGPSAFPVTVHYATANGSALAGQDYTATSGNLTFAAGVTSQTISVPITNDLVYEGTETFNVNLTAPTNATVADGLGVGTILDNDQPPPNLLEGSIITNTNIQSQVVRLTFTETGDPTHTYSSLLTLESQGQQQQSTLTNFSVDVGFNIDPAQQYVVAVQWVSGPKVLITGMTIEGVTIVDHGNVALDADAKNDGQIFLSQIQPSLGATSGLIDHALVYDENNVGNDNNNTLSGNGIPSTLGDHHVVTFSSSDDVLVGKDGDDTLSGNAGNDVLYGGAGGDTLNGGAGNDTATYFNSNAAVTINLETHSASGGHATGDVLTGIENVVGSEGYGDTLTGDAGNNIIVGLAGNDVLTGGGGNDVLVGGKDNDTLGGGAGNDILNGNSGSDTLTGGVGSDTFLYRGIGDAGDTIIDFQVNPVGSGGDVLNVAEVLAGSSFDGNPANLGAFLTFETSGLNTIVSVDLDGAGGGAPVQLAILQGVTFANSSEALTTLLGNNQIDYTL